MKGDSSVLHCASLLHMIFASSASLVPRAHMCFAFHSIATNARPQHRELHALLFTISVWVPFCPLLTITLKMQETGPIWFIVLIQEDLNI